MISEIMRTLKYTIAGYTTYTVPSKHCISKGATNYWIQKNKIAGLVLQNVQFFFIFFQVLTHKYILLKDTDFVTTFSSRWCSTTNWSFETELLHVPVSDQNSTGVKNAIFFSWPAHNVCLDTFNMLTHSI